MPRYPPQFGAPRHAIGTAVIFLGDQFPMPRQQRFRCDDFCDLRQKAPAQFLGEDGKPPPLVIAESKSLGSDLFSQHPVLFHQKFDDVLLMAVHPSSDGDDDK